MNLFPSRRGIKGFTLVELLVVIAIIGILAALLLPALNLGKLRAKQSFCENNLSQIGIGFHIFGHDHDSKFPMAVSMDEGGAMEFVENGYRAGDIFYFGFHVFQTLSNSLAEPRILICPADLNRVAASNFPHLQNTNVSYFYNANADFLDANSILIGDRNIATNSVLQPTILRLGGGSRLRWTRELHQFKGNILFADGHVEEWNKSKLQFANDTLSKAADLFMPSVLPANFNFASGNSGGGSGGGAGDGGGNGNSTSDLNSSPSGGPQNPGPNSPLPANQLRSLNVNDGNSPPNSSGGKPALLSINGSSKNSGLNENFGANHSQNLQFEKQTNLPSQIVRSNVAGVTPDNPEPPMSPLDQKITKVVRGTFEWGYFLLLLLLLLFLAYKLWQILRRDKNRRRRSRDDFPPQL